MIRLMCSLSLLLTLLWGCLAPPVQAAAARPTRAPGVVLPATIAFKSHDALWLVNGRNAKEQPKRMTFQGIVDLVDWSPDGQWFAFLKYLSPMETSDAKLWVVKADGTVMKQVDAAAVLGMPEWSPTENQLVYRTWNRSHTDSGVAKLARVTKDGDVELKSIVEASEHLSDVTWEPSGTCLTLSLPRTAKQPLRIDRLCLNGTRKNLYAEPGLAPEKPDSIYVRDAQGLKWSPDGRHLSYFQFLSSASIVADGVPIQVLDAHTGRSRRIGVGLGYREWLAWSPDSRQLAYIVGSDRMVTHNKQLHLFDAQTGKIQQAGVSGYVDTNPVWSLHQPGELLFQRGPAGEWPSFDPPRVVVRDQRIWSRTRDGRGKALTSGPPATADYMPQLAPDGKSLLFLRLRTYQEGSFYWQPLEDAQPPAEFLRGIVGRDHGYYGNYLPAWVKVSWK